MVMAKKSKRDFEIDFMTFLEFIEFKFSLKKDNNKQTSSIYA